MEKITKIEYYCKDECYCDWFKCENCKDTMITENSNYCPNCGFKIKK